MNLVSIEPPAARVALTRELLKLLDAALGIVSAGYGLQAIADQLIETLAESFGFLSRASYELLIDREGDVHGHCICGHVLCVIPLPESPPESLYGRQFPAAGTSPYFSSHFNSSRTLILPCQGFFDSEWPSPGKISNWLGMPSEDRACSSR